MIASIHQPAYLPWLGYFEKIAAADVFVFFDTTQFEKNSYINRNKINTDTGAQWLTVPVETKGKFQNNVLIDTKIVSHSNWNIKHWKSIEQAYKHAPFFSDYAADIEKFYTSDWTSLSDLCWEMLRYFVTLFELSTRLVRSSELDGVTGVKTDIVISLCKTVGADTYISGALGRNYLEEEKFTKENITLSYQDFKHPVYPQRSKDFVSHLAVIDALFNCGVRDVMTFIQSSTRVDN